MLEKLFWAVFTILVGVIAYPFVITLLLFFLAILASMVVIIILWALVAYFPALLWKVYKGLKE